MSVIIVTGAQREVVARALRSVLENQDPRFDAWIVDKSPDVELPDSLRPLVADPRVHYLRTKTIGSTRIHNEAIARAVGDLVALTDDDCEVSEVWIEEMIRAFDSDPRVGVVFGNVHPARPGSGSVAYIRAGDFLARDLRDKARVEGIWACMGVRRQTWAALGGFDERFGQGARFPGCADADLAIRALAAGHFVFETPRVSVRSHRALPPDEHRRVVQDYSYASGALIGKHLRRRTPGILRLLSVLARRWTGGGSHSAMGLGSDPQRWRRLAAFLRGVVRGVAASDR